MYIVNISFFVESKVQNSWLNIVNNQFLPLIEKEGYKETIFSRVITEKQVGTSFTYSLMVEVETLKEYQHITGEILDLYKEMALPLFGEDVLWHITLLKKLDN